MTLMVGSTKPPNDQRHSVVVVMGLDSERAADLAFSALQITVAECLPHSSMSIELLPVSAVPFALCCRRQGRVALFPSLGADEDGLRLHHNTSQAPMPAMEAIRLQVLAGRRVRRQTSRPPIVKSTCV